MLETLLFFCGFDNQENTFQITRHTKQNEHD